jgi:hypothetical protein
MSIGSLIELATDRSLRGPRVPRSRVSVALLGTFLLASRGSAMPPGLPGSPPVSVSMIDIDAEAIEGTRLAALASADFDEDGVPDVASIWTGEAKSVAVVHRGNVEAIFPHWRGPSKALPVLPDPVLVLVDSPLDLLAAGDFDADGHFDLGAAASGGSVLFLFCGDGKGHFAAPRIMSMAGSIADLRSADLNQPDGLADLVLSLRTPTGGEVAVLESPRGAFFAEPELFPLPSTPTDLRTGDLDQDGFVDIAATIADRVVVVRGRPRRLYATGLPPGAVPDARVSVVSFDDPLLAPVERDRLPSGRGIGRACPEPTSEPLASIPVRFRLSDEPSLVMIRPGERALKVVSLAPAATFFVASTADSGPGSLRQAMLDANASSGADAISFAIPGTPPFQIVPILPLPTISEAVTIDAQTQPGWSNAPIVELVGSYLGPNQPGFSIAASATIRGFVINRFPGAAISFTGNGSGAVAGCYIGLDPTGTSYLANGGGGISISTGVGAGAVSVGGTTVADRNVIAGGISSNAVSGEMTVLGNYLGTDRTGMSRVGPVSNLDSGGRATIGGTAAGAGNVIAGPVHLGDGSGGLIQGNLVGLAADGTTPIGAGAIRPWRNGMTTGGSTASARNVIGASTGCGIDLTWGQSSQIIGNYIGTDSTGLVARPNAGSGIQISTGYGNGPYSFTIAGNVIGGNVGQGIACVAGGDYMVTGGVIQGNRIGVGADGVLPMPNGSDGISLGSPCKSTTVGGDGGQNVIRNNGGAGIRVTSSTGFAIRANSIDGNAGLGIDLGPSGVTPNDPLDSDTGANELQNFPLLSGLSWSGGTTTVSGTLASTPSAAFWLDFFDTPALDPSGNGEGETWLASTGPILSDATGVATFSVPLPGLHSIVSATATSTAYQATSEFSGGYAALGEAGTGSSLRATPSSTGESIDLQFFPACGATSHAIFLGSGSIASGPVWSEAHCSLPTSGTASFDPAASSAGGLVYFVLVGQNGSREGSYGRDSAGAERPEAVGVGACDRSRLTSGSCP